MGMITSLLATTALTLMPLKDQVGQVFIGFIHGASLDQDNEAFIKKTRLGNFIYFGWANELSSMEQVRAFSKELNAIALKEFGQAPIIAVDQEGGRVQRLKQGFRPIPAARDVAQSDARELYLQAALELKSVGVTLNFAPVVDVDSNPKNPVIATRSFGNSPDRVIALAREALFGMHQANVGCTLKHFPGHGDTGSDSHTSLPVVNKTFAELEACELLPFRALAPEADAIMTAHIVAPKIDPLPASLSPFWIQQVLRKELGFKGLIISDSLVMRGIAPKQQSFEEAVQSVAAAAIRAFLAGSDLLIVGRLEWGDFKTTQVQDRALIEQVMAIFLDAVKSGAIPEERLRASVERVAKFKETHQNLAF